MGLMGLIKNERVTKFLAIFQVIMRKKTRIETSYFLLVQNTCCNICIKQKKLEKNAQKNQIFLRKIAAQKNCKKPQKK